MYYDFYLLQSQSEHQNSQIFPRLLEHLRAKVEAPDSRNDKVCH